MANFTASNLVSAQAKIAARFQEPELRRKQNPALVLALKNLSATIPSHNELRTREDRAVNAMLFKRRASSGGTARAARPSGTKGDSLAVGLTWQTLSETFTISMKQAGNNVFSYQEMLANEMMQAVQNLHDRLGTTSLSYLVAHRNALPISGPVGAAYNATTHAYEIASVDSKYYFQKLTNIMRQANYRGLLDIIVDPAAFSFAQQLRAQGSQNATNTAFQFDQIGSIIETTEVISASYTAGVSLAMPEGTFALLPWIPKQNREGHGDYDSYNGGYGVLADPLGTTIQTLDAVGNPVNVPLDFAVYAYTQASDDSANNGFTQDQVTTFELSIDIAPTLAPLSGSNEFVVNMFGQL